MLKEFKEHIINNFPFLMESKSLIAISGGVDSVVLAYLCKEIGLDVALAHCNFNLRGKESNEDQRFIEALGIKLNIETFVQEFDTQNFAKVNKISIQMAARDLRYGWFDELCKQLHFDYLLTAHHADDNLETFLINLSRGSGLDGLTGIPEINENIVRPLLLFTKDEIVAFAQEMNIGWREDESNTSTKYLRNKLRHEVIPILKGINSQMLNNFTETIDHLKGSKQIIEDRIDEVSDEIVDVKPNGIHLNIEVLKSQNNPKAYLYELLKDYGFTEWNDVADLLNSQSGTQVFSKEWRLLKDRDYLIVSELLEEEEYEIFIDKDQDVVSLPNGTLEIELVKSLGKSSNQIIYADLEKLKFPLAIRKKRDGDFFYPLGMIGKKKMSKYFKDEKFSLLDKENTLLLCSGDDIVWVIGHRADNRFKVSKSTKDILRLKIK